MMKSDLLEQIGKLRFRVQELEAEIAKLSDPISVHANMLIGKIAKPSFDSIKHLYADDFAKMDAEYDRLLCHAEKMASRLEKQRADSRPSLLMRDN